MGVRVGVDGCECGCLGVGLDEGPDMNVDV